jgi:hypothetical protein
MNFRNTKSGKYNPYTDNSSYVLVRSDVFYFLQFINYEKELFKTNSTLSSSPNIIFYTENSVNKVILDYTNANNTDKKYLNSFFANMSVDSGFTLLDGEYLKESVELEADLTCNLKFKEFKNNYVFAELNSVIDKDSAADVYENFYFLKTPQLYSGITLGSNKLTTSVALVNKKINNKSLFSNLGLKKDDIIEIINPNSQNNGKKFTINNIEEISNNELLLLKGPAVAVSESLTGLPVLINVYVKSNLNKNNALTLNIDNSLVSDSDIGCCIVADDQYLNIAYNSLLINSQSNFDANNIFTTGFDTVQFPNLILKNTTKKQCSIITGRNDRFVKDCFIQNNLVRLTTATVENSEFFASPINTLKISFVDNKFTFSRADEDQSSVFFYNVKPNVLELQQGYVYKFVQKDISNSNRIIRFSLDSGGKIPYVKNIWGKDTGSGINSLIYFKVPTEAEGINSLYMYTEKSLSVPIRIQIGY